MYSKEMKVSKVWGVSAQLMKSNQLCIYFQKSQALRFETPTFMSFPNLQGPEGWLPWWLSQ